MENGSRTGRQAEVFTALPTPRIQAERTQPFVHSDGDGGDVERREYRNPQLRRKRQQER